MKALRGLDIPVASTATRRSPCEQHCLHPGEPLFLMTMASFDAGGIETSFVHLLNFKDLGPR